jgi:hypothetical protein
VTGPGGGPGDGGPGSVPVSVLGMRFDIDVADRAVGAELRRLLGPFVVPASTSDSTRARRMAGPAAAAPQLLDETLAELNAAALAAVDCLAVHAGAVAAAGQVVAFPGPSGIGKSTLTAACLRAGLEYVSDEALCLHWDTGEVIGYPRPMALSGWSAVALGLAGRPTDEVLVTAADLGAAVATGPLRLAHVVLVERAGEGAPTTLDPAPRSRAVAEMLRRSFTHWRAPDRAFTLVHHVMSKADAWRLTLGDPRSAAESLAGLLRDRQ